MYIICTHRQPPTHICIFCAPVQRLDSKKVTHSSYVIGWSFIGKTCQTGSQEESGKQALKGMEPGTRKDPSHGSMELTWFRISSQPMSSYIPHISYLNPRVVASSHHLSVTRPLEDSLDYPRIGSPQALTSWKQIIPLWWPSFILTPPDVQASKKRNWIHWIMERTAPEAETRLLMASCLLPALFVGGGEVGGKNEGTSSSRATLLPGMPSL